MKVLLWVLQIALALLYLSGGAYKTFMFDELADQLRALSRAQWGALGVFEMVGGVLLIVPAALKWLPSWPSSPTAGTRSGPGSLNFSASGAERRCRGREPGRPTR